MDPCHSCVARGVHWGLGGPDCQVEGPCRSCVARGVHWDLGGPGCQAAVGPFLGEDLWGLGGHQVPCLGGLLGPSQVGQGDPCWGVDHGWEVPPVSSAVLVDLQILGEVLGAHEGLEAHGVQVAHVVLGVHVAQDGHV